CSGVHKAGHRCVREPPAWGTQPSLWCDPSSPAKSFRWKLVLENPVPNSFGERKGRSAAGAPFLHPKDSFHDAFYSLYFYQPSEIADCRDSLGGCRLWEVML